MGILKFNRNRTFILIQTSGGDVSGNPAETRIGFIGVGLMGHGMAKHLLAKGFPVTVMAHRNRTPVEDLLAKGAKEGRTPAEIAKASDVVILCVTGSPQVEGLFDGAEGLMGAVRQGLVIIDCSTAEPDSTAKLRAGVEAKGGVLVDAPLARTPKEAEEGRLNTMVGAAAEAFERVKPVLAAFCENIFHVGGFGAGHKMKLVNNFLAMGQAALISEAFVACAKTGVDLDAFFKVVSGGGVNSGIFQMLVGKGITGDYSGLLFGLSNGAKDLRYYSHLLESAQMAGPLAAAILQTFIQAMNMGYGDKYVPSLIEAQAQINGVPVPKAK